ncbi:hypothetical protein P7C73_g2362, partial [Tremellales sp. Uapishka_1]
MASRTWNRVWVGGTLSLISFISFSSQIFVVWPQYGRTLSIELIKVLLPFNLFIFMVFWNYRLCVITPPGSVPPGWRPNLSALEGMEVKKGNHGPRYCKTCEHYKPPRGEHITVDNAKPVCSNWTIIVLGSRTASDSTIKATFSGSSSGLTLRRPTTYSSSSIGSWSFLVARLYVCTLDKALLPSLILHLPQEEPSLSDILFLIFNFAACVPVWLCVGMFSMYHFYLACGNSTTIEGWEKDKVATLIRRGKIKEVKYPYALGLVANLKSVLGPNPLLWLWPQAMRGDGLSFPVNPEAGDSNAQYLWPPQDPTRLPNPAPIDASASPFVYGDGFNPRLRPSKSRNHARSGDPSPWETELNSSGEERDNDSLRSSSSPEPYLSDYDDEDVGPMKVRRGSEGLEVRPTQHSWNQLDCDDDFQGRIGARPWEENGRYNVYVPEGDAVDEGSDGWGE